MKKLTILGLTAVLTSMLSIGAVLAAEKPVVPSSPNGWTFEDMLPYMKKMHPSTSDDTLKDMYNACHGPNGMMKNGPRTSPMK